MAEEYGSSRDAVFGTPSLLRTLADEAGTEPLAALAMRQAAAEIEQLRDDLAEEEGRVSYYVEALKQAMGERKADPSEPRMVPDGRGGERPASGPCDGGDMAL